MAGSLVSDLAILPTGWRRPPAPAVRRRVLASGAAAIAATLLNPFGLEGAIFPVILIGRLGGDVPIYRSIGELRRPFENYFVTFSVTAYQLLIIFGGAAVAAALLLAAFGQPAASAPRAERRRKGAPAPAPAVAAAPAPPRLPVDLADVAVFAALACLSLLARRRSEERRVGKECRL